MEHGYANVTTVVVCQDPHSYNHQRDIWHSGNPLHSPTSLLFMQISMIALVSQGIDVCLKPLGQSSLVSQILGGMIFGPSVLGHESVIRNTLFPARGALVFETVASFGLMFVFFIMSLKADPATLIKTEKLAIVIGLSVFSSTLAISAAIAYLLKKYVPMDKGLESSLMVLACTQALTVFVCIQIMLNDLKILNTDAGRLALNSSLFADCTGFAMAVVVFSILGNKSGKFLTLLSSILGAVALFLLIVFVMRPTILWLLKHLAGGLVHELHIICTFIFLLIVGFLTQVIGHHFIMGSILLGFAFPEGPPLGTTLLNKLETLCMGFLYPMYLAVCGLQANIFAINFRSLWIVSMLVLISCMVKIGATMLPGYYNNIPMKDCCVMGIMMNARGVPELCMYTAWKSSKILTESDYTIMVLTILVINVILAPLLRYLYDPSMQYQSVTRCSIQHTKQESELRLMVCILNNENIPTIINVLEASYASNESAVAAIALILVELLGRSRPLLVAHQHHDTLRSVSCTSTQIGNALMQYAQHNQGFASVYSFTSMSNYETMHDDVRRISLEMGANILIMPFHKRWEIDGSVEVINRSIQTMIIRVLETAPCSVGILIDRGVLSGYPSLLVAGVEYNVVVIFIGGSADDVEALALGTRMARHASVNVTVIRFLLFGEENSKDRKRDTDLIEEYRYFNATNRRFDVMNQVVRDGIEMSMCIRRMIDNFDLVIVGKEHPESIMLEGHEQWSECKELGVVGDMLTSKDFMTKASVLVVQQQRLKGKHIKHILTNNRRDHMIHDVPTDPPPR